MPLPNLLKKERFQIKTHLCPRDMKTSVVILLALVFTIFIFIIYETTHFQPTTSFSKTQQHDHELIDHQHRINDPLQQHNQQRDDEKTEQEEATESRSMIKDTESLKIIENNKNSKHQKQKQKQQPPLLNGVIMYLYGGRWYDYFVNNALPRLDEYFVSCFPYPVLVFHEDAPDAQKQAIIRALPKGQNSMKKRMLLDRQQQESPQRQQREDGQSSSLVRFDDVSEIWKNLPPQVSLSKLKTWLNDPLQKKFQGRGYRIMCRFWAGLVWLRKSLDEFEYYWRLDTDSILTRPVLIDPFRLVFLQKKCVYGFNRLKGENPHVATNMFETFKSFLKLEVEGGHLTSDQERECIRFVTVRSDGGSEKSGKFWAPMYYNNFEMGTMQLKRSDPYQRFFRFIDENEPFGIFRYRWGDAPLHTLGILVAQGCSTRLFCNVTFSEVPYRHAVTRIPAMVSNSEKCQN